MIKSPHGTRWYLHTKFSLGGTQPPYADDQGFHSIQYSMRTYGRPAAAVPWHLLFESIALLVVVLFTEVELPVAHDHTPHDQVPHGTYPGPLSLTNTISVAHHFLYDNSNDSTVAYSSIVPASASSCPVLRPSDLNFASAS
ncbi:hypothetical protein BHM03_00041579 [Ensete ventricosum]|nr:hypothetical protein BHM03_00041579 [Ensete ventricosum]